MMAGPGDGMAAVAAGPDFLRASRADRERAIDVLKVAFVQGRLAKDEFDARIGQVLTSRTYADLAVITADIPVRLTGAHPVCEPRQARPRRQVNYAVKWCAYGFIMPMFVAGALAVAFWSGSAAVVVMALLAFLFFLVWVPTSSRDGAGRGHVERCRRGQLPPRR